MLEEKEGVMRNAMTTRAPCGAKKGHGDNSQSKVFTFSTLAALNSHNSPFKMELSTKRSQIFYNSVLKVEFKLPSLHQILQWGK